MYSEEIGKQYFQVRFTTSSSNEVQQTRQKNKHRITAMYICKKCHRKNITKIRYRILMVFRALWTEGQTDKASYKY